MQRCVLLILACLMCIQCVTVRRTQSRQDRDRPLTSYAEAKIGATSPEDLAEGTNLGLAYGQAMDDRLHWTAELNYFTTSFRSGELIAVPDSIHLGQYQASSETVDVEFTSHAFSPYALIFWQSPSYESRGSWYLRGAGGIGLEVIWQRENNFLERRERSRVFTGFGLQFQAGLGKRISRNGTLFADIYYKNGKASKRDSDLVNGLPIYDEIDLSGYGFRGGIHYRF